jgi:hypothetical protein
MDLRPTAYPIELAGPLAAVRAVLADPDSHLCLAGQTLDLPILGRRSQTVQLDVDVADHCIEFSCAGDLWSVSGRWRLETDGGEHVKATLEVECRIAEELRRQAVDEYRSRSPLPIRTDADAILGRLVEDLFREKLGTDVAAYRQRVAELVERRGGA